MSYSTDVRATGAIDEADLSADEQPQVRNMRQRLQLAVVNPWKHITSGDVSGSLGDLGTFLPLTVSSASASTTCLLHSPLTPTIQTQL